jgi:hypothetical protein
LPPFSFLFSACFCGRSSRVTSKFRLAIRNLR